ncbi:hypothetical protein TRICI_006432 [Trichomonascus ciferrii]|uniref:MoaB/Mog domain-containing protein n=1 Tax=Trichomonascus ciferrii TaxID=44093 RepID=A0A642UH78_9ASCO|nr:hypothetical protein TRICI_006432 [Trichomonascus ciferrii]
MSGYKVTVIVVSDSVSAGKSTDGVVEAVKDVLSAHSLFRPSVAEISVEVVPDEVDDIESAVTSSVRNSGGLILTSGGTGCAERDRTPEVVSSLLDKATPGITQLMLSESFKTTPLAALSRPISGVIGGNSLVVTLPGSPKAVKENLTAIIDILPHALDLIEQKQSSRELHAHSQSHSHSHGHSHKNNHHSQSHGHHNGPKFHELVPSMGGTVAQRPRKSPYPMVPVDDAQSTVVKEAPLPQQIVMSILDEDLVSHIVAEDVYSEVDVPNFRASIVDGYAVMHSDCPGAYDLFAVSHAAPSGPVKMMAGTVVRVTTGAPVPHGATAVVPVEETKVAELTPDGKEEKKIEILAQNVSENDNVRQIGSDVKRGTRILQKGIMISTSGGEIGLLASVGVTKVKVYKKPVVGILSTGDELVDINQKIQDPNKKLTGGQIFDSNRPSLISMVRSWGYKALDLKIAKDNSESLCTQVKRAYQELEVDVIITTGGVSMGEMDLLKPTIEIDLQGKLHFGRVAMKPGKPTTFGTFDFEDLCARKLIFALPGNPASATVTFHLFVLPALRKFSGFCESQCLLPKINVEIQSEVKLDPRPEYHRVTISTVLTAEGQTKFQAQSTGFQRSSAISSMKEANALLCLPSSTDTQRSVLPAGSLVPAILIGQL